MFKYSRYLVNTNEFKRYFSNTKHLSLSSKIKKNITRWYAATE